MTTLVHDNIQAHAFKASLSEKDFRRLSEFIHNECGIKMLEGKKVLLEARLRRDSAFWGCIHTPNTVTICSAPKALLMNSYR